MSTPIRIAMTQGSSPKPSFAQYGDWLRAVEPAAEIVVVSDALGNADALDAAHGIVLTGGGDVHPGLYGQESALNATDGVDERRDAFEFDIIDRALTRDLPILAVCRGMQVLNVFLGGSLVVDLVSAGFNDHTGSAAHVQRHGLHVDRHAMLYFAAGAAEIVVNSYHHQSVDRPGNGLRPVAFSPDGVIEAAEWAMKDGMPFLLAVQWHPERDPGDPTSKNIASLFLREVRSFAATTITRTTST